jgi:hypothetical protein
MLPQTNKNKAMKNTCSLRLSLILTFFLLTSFSNMTIAHAEEFDCGADSVWDLQASMCMPLGKIGETTSMAMVHGNLFLVGLSGQSPRMRTALAAPNMFMLDAGTNFESRHYFNIDLMGTFENYTFPASGYPELMQVGEHDSLGRPYVDAQHPHSTPLMGLTISDTIRISSDSGYDTLKIFVAPRGESTDGPLAFMHRPTGEVNPDAPLGHHLGQDAGHITSSVIGFSAKFDWLHLEASTFYGREPEPTRLEVPVAVPNSYAVRTGFEYFKDHLFLMSIASLKNPEGDQSDNFTVTRYSASVTDHFKLSETWDFSNVLIFGSIYNYDNTTVMSSWAEEFLFKGEAPRIWARFEYLQRTPAELGIPGGIVNYYNDPRWIGLATLGYTHKVFSADALDFSVGTSASANFIPGEFVNTYGSLPLTTRVFLQVGGMGMWDL